jgi:exosortase
MQYDRIVALLAVAGCALYGFASMFVRVAGVFQDDLEDMSFGWMVPVFSLYVLWTERGELRRSALAPSFAGLLACLPCAAIAFFGARGLQVRFEQLGFIGLCIAVPWAFFGRRTAKCFVFPALFLLFTIPMSSYLDLVTVHLRLVASGTAIAVMRGLGFEVVQRGTAIYSTGAHPFAIDVAAPCSGLRSIFALMTLTAAYAWFSQTTWPRRAVLFACSVPLAVLGNVVRVMSICLVAAWANPKFALGFYHDYSGYVVFVVAISLMVACGELVARVADRFAASRAGKGAAADKKAVSAAPSGDREAAPSSILRRAVPWISVAVLCPVFVFQAATPSPRLADAPEVALPAAIAGYDVDEVAYCQNEQCAAMFPRSGADGASVGEVKCPKCGGETAGCSLGERTVLPADTVIVKRMYSSPHGPRFLVSVVTGGRSKSSIHRPELCMPAQGYLMRSPRDIAVGEAKRPFRAIRLERPGVSPVTHAYTFFNQRGLRTSSHARRILADTWARSVLNRIDRWVMVTVHASNQQSMHGFSLDSSADRSALERFLADLTRRMP